MEHMEQTHKTYINTYQLTFFSVRKAMEISHAAEVVIALYKLKRNLSKIMMSDGMPVL